MTALSDMVLRLSSAFGPSGEEGEVRALFREFCPDVPWRVQRMGNIMAEIQGVGEYPRVMLAAHMDEIGIMVQTLMDGGWGRFIPLGSWPANALPAQRFRLRNAKVQEYMGVVGTLPPHFLKEDERNRALRIEDLHLDFGVQTPVDIEKLGVEKGDMGVPDGESKLLPSGLVLGKAMDDRAGCALMLEVLRRIKNHPNTLIPVGTVQEEVGTRGIQAAGRELRPDVAFILEGAPTDERPGAPPQTAVGRGPQLRFYDATLIAHRPLVRWLLNLAREEGIPYQTAVRSSGGTDGGAIHKEGEGIPTVVVGIPVRYAHSHQGFISLQDLEHGVKLVTKAIERLDAATFNTIVSE